MSSVPTLAEPNFGFGDHLRKARKQAGYSGAQMAALLTARLGRKVTKQTVANWENDASQPRGVFEVAEAWADLCAVSREWLLRSRCFAPSSLLSVLDGGNEPDDTPPPILRVVR